MTPLATFLIKLPLALLVFLLVAYAGTANRRIAGVLFTFPILNGIAIIASDEPVVVADAIYPLVIFNCALFAALLSFPQTLPPAGLLPRWSQLPVRIIVWTVAWLIGATVITDFSREIPGGGILLAGAAVFAFVFMRLFWSHVADNAPSAQTHSARFIAFWNTRTGLWRIVFFIVTYGVVFWAARTALDQKWVGMASALPLPGFFALAALIDDAEEKRTPMTSLRAIRDTLFLGPVLVIPFNWSFSHALLAMPGDAVAARYLLLFAMWTIAALAALMLVPQFAAWRDARGGPR